MMLGFSLYILPLFILGVIIYALIKKVNVYESFIEGAKKGAGLALRIFPYIVAMMFAVGIFSSSGGLELFQKLMDPVLVFFSIPAGVIPLFIMRPFSGSASFGILAGIFKAYGPDSYTSRVASTMMGSSETLFYTVSLYFGSVGIKKTRYTIPVVLIADVIGLITASIVCSLFF